MTPRVALSLAGKVDAACAIPCVRSLPFLVAFCRPSQHVYTLGLDHTVLSRLDTLIGSLGYLSSQIETLATVVQDGEEGGEASKKDPSAVHNASLEACQDVLRFLLKQGRYLRSDPRAIVQLAAAAPPASAVGRAAAAFYRKPEARVLNPPSGWGHEVWSVHLGSYEAQDVAWSPDAKLVLAVGASPDWDYDNPGGVVAVLHATTGQVVAKLAGHTPGRRVLCCAWSPAGDIFATGGSGGSVCWWHADTGTVTRSWPSSSQESGFEGWSDPNFDDYAEIYAVRFSDDGKRFAVASEVRCGST